MSGTEAEEMPPPGPPEPQVTMVRDTSTMPNQSPRVMITADVLETSDHGVTVSVRELTSWCRGIQGSVNGTSDKLMVLQRLVMRLDASVDFIAQRIDKMDERVDVMSQRLDLSCTRVEACVRTKGHRIGQVERIVDHLSKKVSGVEQGLQHFETLTRERSPIEEEIEKYLGYVWAMSEVPPQPGGDPHPKLQRQGLGGVQGT